MADPYAGIGAAAAHDPYSGVGAPAPAATVQHPSGLEDVARSAWGGLVNGVTSLADLTNPTQQIMMGAKIGAGLVSPHAAAVVSRITPPTTSSTTGPIGGNYAPRTTGGRYAHAVAAMAPNAVLPEGLVPRVAAAVLPGVAQQGATDLAQAAGADAGGQAVAGFVGGLAGGGLTGLARSAAKVPQILSEEEKPVASAIQAALDVTGHHRDDVKAITSAGVLPAAATPGLTQLADAVTTQPGTGQTLIRDAVGQRFASQSQRALQAVQGHLDVDPAAAHGDVDAIVKQGQQTVKPLYDALTNNPAPVMSPRLAVLAQTPAVKKAINLTVQDMLNDPDGPSPTTAGFKLNPDTGGWEMPTPWTGAAAMPSAKASAEAAGFDTSRVFYHGTHTAEPNLQSNKPAGEISPRGIYLSSDPDLASQYAENRWGQRVPNTYPNVRPVYVKSGAIRTDPMIANFDKAFQTMFYVEHPESVRSIFDRGSPASESLGGIAEQQPTAATWIKVHQSLGQSVDRNPTTNAVIPDSISRGNRNIGLVGRKLGDELKTAIPGYGDALAQSGDYLSTRGAFNRASGMLFSKPVYDFQQMWGSLKNPSEVKAAQAAIANDILTKSEGASILPGAFKNPGVRQKMAIAFPGKSEAFLQQMEDDLAERRALGGVIGGSQTASRQALGKQLAANTAKTVGPVRRAAQAVTTGIDNVASFTHPLTAFTRIAKMVAGSNAPKDVPPVWENPQTNAALGELLSDPKKLVPFLDRMAAQKAIDYHMARSGGLLNAVPRLALPGLLSGLIGPSANAVTPGQPSP